MITDDDAPEMLAAAEVLGEQVMRLRGTGPVTITMLSAIEDVIYSHRVRTRANGVLFPEMTIMCVPRLNIIHLVPRENDMAGIRKHVLNFVAAYPSCTPDDVAHAMRMAWRHVAPGDLVANTDEVIERKEKYLMRLPNPPDDPDRDDH